MPRPSLHHSLAAPWEACELVRRDLMGILSRVDPQAWTTRAKNGSWTLAQQVDHLIRAEVGTSKIARRIIRGDFRDTMQPPGARRFDSSLAEYPYGRLPAPAGLEPQTIRFNDAIQQLDAVRQRFVEELLRFDGPDADAVAAPDPATGVWFTLGGWLKLQALHEQHHVAQIRALLAAS
jgi:hypothetical protein